MTTYTAKLTITACTAWATWHDASAIACHYTATAWEWYTESFFSARAKARYEWVGQLIGCLVALVYLYAKRWVDAEVEAALPAADAVEVAPVEVDPFCPSVNPLPAIAVVEVEPLSELSIRQLKAMASGKVPNYGRMTKPQLVEALRAA